MAKGDQRPDHGLPDSSGSDEGSVSGIAIPLALPPPLRRLRQRWDLGASQGARPHVTVLYPFGPEATLTTSVRAELAAIAAAVAPFEVGFRRVRRFHGVVWLEPEPADPFRALTAAIERRWPAYPAYGGVFDDVIPHLTIAESDHAPLVEIEAEAASGLPFTSQARVIELWVRGGEGRWRPRWRLRLGEMPVRR
jgi:2'-5' RNA ligase